jgi:CubicO group peptidase (beta-lactamase class C family)
MRLRFYTSGPWLRTGILILLFGSFTFITFSQTRFETSDPEAQGVSSAGLLQYLDALEKSSHEMHSFMLLRHGKIVAQGWWDPYSPELRHTMYSCSKSFTATAIGFAVQEKRLKLSDPVIGFFPGDLPATVTPNLAKLTIKDVLIMSDGMEPDPSFKVAASDSNWVRGFLSTPIIHEPGTQFLYNSLGTYMLSAIITKVTGQRLVDYLKPRLFDPLGIIGMDWEEDTKGNNAGGWGLRIKTEDMARFTTFFLQKGKWNGRQLLDESWINEASTAHILQDPKAPQSKKDSSDWLQGYGYQMWRCRNNAYRGDGAFGQYMLVMPEQDAVMVITSETADLQGELDLVWKYVLPAMKEGKLLEDKANAQLLKTRFSHLALPVTAADAQPRGIAFERVVYKIEDNGSGIGRLSFDLKTDQCQLEFSGKKGTYSFQFGKGHWVSGTTSKPLNSLTAAAIEHTDMLYPAKVVGAFAWIDEHTLQFKLRYIESPHSETYTCTFSNGKLDMELKNSFDFGKTTTTLHGNLTR